jgi:hypothetical protein
MTEERTPTPPFALGAMPHGRHMRTVDERIVHSTMKDIFDLVRFVDAWPKHLKHYRYVRFQGRTTDGGGIVEMSANRPFGPFNWPTRWVSEMQVLREGGKNGDNHPRVRFRHIGGITTGMDVEWTFVPVDAGIKVKVVHLWDGPDWPLIGEIAATSIIGPVFVHGIASRTLAGLAVVAERAARERLPEVFKGKR